MVLLRFVSPGSLLCVAMVFNMPEEGFINYEWVDMDDLNGLAGAKFSEEAHYFK